MSRDEIESAAEAAVQRAIAGLLVSFGIDAADQKERTELRANFIHLRRRRKSVEQAQSYTVTAVITVAIGGVLGALWLGFKTMLGK
jgi:hypothetical protein